MPHATSPSTLVRIGIDWGGTKIEILAIDPQGRELHRERISTPQRDYEGAIRAAAALVDSTEKKLGGTCTIGVGMPGIINPHTGLVKNANSTWLIGKPLRADLEKAFHREIRCANDANCLALSEAIDGAGAGKHVVFAAILGTGCGAGIAIGGKVHSGLNGLAGEWGHTPLPWQRADEYPGCPCYCGQRGCIETWISGTGFAADFEHHAAEAQTAEEIVALASPESPQSSHALAALDRYEDRLARSLGQIINVLDPDVIVLGGGMSKVARLYENVPPLLPQYAFGREAITPVFPAKHGDSSGVRGAAWLWPLLDH